MHARPLGAWRHALGGQRIRWAVANGCGGFLDGCAAGSSRSVLPILRPRRVRLVLDHTGAELRCWMGADGAGEERPPRPWAAAGLLHRPLRVRAFPDGCDIPHGCSVTHCARNVSSWPRGAEWCGVAGVAGSDASCRTPTVRGAPGDRNITRRLLCDFFGGSDVGFGVVESVEACTVREPAHRGGPRVSSRMAVAPRSSRRPRCGTEADCSVTYRDYLHTSLGAGIIPKRRRKEARTGKRNTECHEERPGCDVGEAPFMIGAAIKVDRKGCRTAHRAERRRGQFSPAA